MYLYGVIQESFRLGYGISQRSPRIARTEDLVYRSQDGKYQYVIPRGTAIGMSTRISHHHEGIFPDSQAFRPERWITSDGQRNLALDKYLMTFSRGSRACLGIKFVFEPHLPNTLCSCLGANHPPSPFSSLAVCEIYLMTAAITLRVLPRMRLYETTWEDVAYDHDLMIPVAKKGTHGIRIVMV